MLGLGEATWQGSGSAVQACLDDYEMLVTSGPIFGFLLSVIKPYIFFNFIGDSLWLK